MKAIGYKLLLKYILLVVMSFTLPKAAAADMPVVYMDEGRALFSFDVPDFWQVRSGGQRSVTPPDADEARLINRVIGMRPSADDGAWMGFISPHGVRTYDEAIEYLSDIGPFVVEDATAKPPRRVSIGGRPAASISGTGRREGRAVSFTAVVIDLPRDRAAIALTVLESGADPSFVDAFNTVFASFRALN